MTKYTQDLGEQISRRIVNGDTIVNICSDSEMPDYAQVCEWRRLYPEFDQLIQQAYKDRSEFYHSEALINAYAADEDNVQSKKLIVDTCKWAAGVDNPERFGTKTKILGDKDQPLTFVIETGVRRIGDAGFNGDINGQAVVSGRDGSLDRADHARQESITGSNPTDLEDSRGLESTSNSEQ